MHVRTRTTLALLLWSTLLPGAAHAVDDYQCTIERVSLASGDSGSTYEFYSTSYVGKEFTVHRDSGLMAGALKNAYVTKPQVIDYGSSENSYKVVTTMRVDEGAGAGSNIYALNVLEFVDAPRKPFVFLMNDAVFFGFCEHF